MQWRAMKQLATGQSKKQCAFCAFGRPPADSTDRGMNVHKCCTCVDEGCTAYLPSQAEK